MATISEHNAALITEDFTAADWADLKREEQAGQWYEHLDLPDDFDPEEDE